LIDFHQKSVAEVVRPSVLEAVQLFLVTYQGVARKSLRRAHSVKRDSHQRHITRLPVFVHALALVAGLSQRKDWQLRAQQEKHMQLICCLQ
jgi:hypothetical protein